jgi:hypothetical protein
MDGLAIVIGNLITGTKGSGAVPPPTPNLIITEDVGDTIITEAGDNIIQQ